VRDRDTGGQLTLLDSDLAFDKSRTNLSAFLRPVGCGKIDADAYHERRRAGDERNV
jgi:hypothetical protein